MTIPIWQRFLASLFYLLPWSDAIPFGRNLFLEFPLLQWLTLPAIPIIIFERLIPFGGIILFFVMFFAIVRNANVSYFLRFNGLQALLLSIIIILISTVFQILLQPISGGLLLSSFSSTALIGVLAIVIFSVFECLQGTEPDLPGLSQAVRMQIF